MARSGSIPGGPFFILELGMRIYVKARPGSREEKIEQIDDTHFVVSVKEPPKEGRANEAVVRTLAEYFKVAPSSIRLVSGFSSKNKIFEIP